MSFLLLETCPFSCQRTCLVGDRRAGSREALAQAKPQDSQAPSSLVAHHMDSLNARSRVRCGLKKSNGNSALLFHNDNFGTTQATGHFPMVSFQSDVELKGWGQG